MNNSGFDDEDMAEVRAVLTRAVPAAEVLEHFPPENMPAEKARVETIRTLVDEFQTHLVRMAELIATMHALDCDAWVHYQPNPDGSGSIELRHTVREVGSLSRREPPAWASKMVSIEDNDPEGFLTPPTRQAFFEEMGIAVPGHDAHTPPVDQAGDGQPQ